MFFGKFCFEEGFLGAVMGTGELALAEAGQAGDKTGVEFWFFLELFEKNCRVQIDHELAELSGDNLAAGFLNGCAWIMYSHRRGQFNRRELNRRERKERRGKGNRGIGGIRRGRPTECKGERAADAGQV